MAMIKRKGILITFCLLSLSCTFGWSNNIVFSSSLMELSVYPTEQFVPKGETTNYNVTIILSNEPLQGLSIDFPDLPSDVVCNVLGPYSIESNDGVAMRFVIMTTPGDETPLGQNTITIEVSSGGISNSTKALLTVESRPETSTSSSIRAICLKTYFMNETNKMFQIYIQGSGEKRISRAEISDQNNNQIFAITTDDQPNVITTPSLKIDNGKPYYVTTESVSNEKLIHMFYCTDHILECFPSDCWQGTDNLNDYEEYLNCFEEAYNILITLTRNGTHIETGGVTINRVPWSEAYGGYGVFVYGTFDSIGYGSVVPGDYATIAHLDTMFHELAHSILMETPGSDLITQEGIACFFEIELFRLLGYPEEYIAQNTNVIINYVAIVGDNKAVIADNFADSATHTGAGAWIVTHVLQDFVGYGTCKNMIEELHHDYSNSNSTDLVPDLGWDFLKEYYWYSSKNDAPTTYNNDEKMLYYFELASGLSLKQEFLDWGFTISDTYESEYSIPEFSSWIILPLFVMGSLTVLAFRKKETKKPSGVLT